MSNQLITITISFGEFYDKYSILLLKRANITEDAKLSRIELEIDQFASNAVFEPAFIANELFITLHNVNTFLWSSEDSIREHILKKSTDANFIALVLENFKYNDLRYEAKALIDSHFSSLVREQKSYSYFTANV